MANQTINHYISNFLDYLTIERNVSPLTVRNYKHWLKRFSNWFSDVLQDNSPAKISVKVIKKYRLYLANYKNNQGQYLSTTTQSYHLIALRAFLRYLAKNDIKSLSPDKIELPKNEARKIKFLNIDQVKRLLSQPSISNIQGLRDKAILEILFSTGLRVSELIQLNRDSVNLKRGEFGIIGKGRRPRVVFLSPRASRWLKKYLNAREDSYAPLFIRHTKKVEPLVDQQKYRLSVRTIQRIVKKYAKKARLPIEATPHTLRHSFGTDLLISGADLRSIQELLGHKNVSTTQIYTHITNPQLKKIHSRFHSLKE